MASRSNKSGSKKIREAWPAASLLVAMRIIRVWNQTGQKRAGQPDIAKTFLPSHNFAMWLLILATYLDIIQRLSRRAVPWVSRQISTAASIALGIAAFGFKVAFTKADAPELLDGLEHFVLRPIEEASLVAQARAVFLGISITMALTVAPAIYHKLSYGGNISGMLASRRNPLDSAYWLVNRSYMATPRFFYTFSHDTNASHQHSSIWFIRDSVSASKSPQSLGYQYDTNVSPAPICLILCFWRIECYLLNRSLERLQWDRRLQCGSRRYTDLLRKLGRPLVVDFCHHTTHDGTARLGTPYKY